MNSNDPTTPDTPDTTATLDSAQPTTGGTPPVEPTPPPVPPVTPTEPQTSATSVEPPAVPPAEPAPVAEEPSPDTVVAESVPPSGGQVAPGGEETPPAAPPVPARPSQPVPQVPPSPQSHELARIAQDFQIRRVHVEAVVQLLDEGNTVPFITRYRKERTGGLDEEMLRRIQLRVTAARALADRKQTILKSIAGQGRLTDPLVAAILDADNIKRLEDLYLPFKPKKRTLASDARDKGLEPAALAIWHRNEEVANLTDTLAGLVNPDKGLNSPDDVATGIRHILAELIAEDANVRGPVRLFVRDTAVLVTAKGDVPDGKGQEFRDYFDFKEPVRMMPPHRVLAVNRGEHEKVLRVKLECDAQRAKYITFDCLPLLDHPHKDFIIPALEDAVDRLLLPSLEREIRREMTEFAQDHGVDIFARNLRSLLLKAPLGGRKVLAVDPGLRTGCKLAVLGETGELIEHGVMYPHPPQKQATEAKRKLEQLIRKYGIQVIAIGNGTACRETEQIVSELIAELAERRANPQPVVAPLPPVVAESTAAAATETITPTAGPVEETLSSPTPTGDADPVSASPPLPTDAPPAAAADTAVAPAPVPVAPPPPAAPVEKIVLDGLPDAPAEISYVIVNEAGASDYSASPIAKEEFPELDATVRGTVSIGRRLQDPLAELVKVDPQHVGVGLYQHDMRPKYLKESLEGVIESCVNAVGVDVNTASVPLLRHVSGLNQLVAREIVEFRAKNGPFKTREQFQSVPQMGEARFTQAAGFLKIRTGDDPLDNTWVHPESYHIAREILTSIGHTPADLLDRAKLAEIREKLKTQNPEAIANQFKVGGPTVRDIFDALAKPGRDVREDRPAPIFRKGVLNLEDLQPGMELKGEILNVVDFGAFVDVGLKDSGLIHISQMANRFIKSPYDVVNVGDVVSVWVNAVDPDRRRVSLSMIPPGQERSFERPPEVQRPPRPDRPPRPERPRQERPDRPPMDRPPPRQDRDRDRDRDRGPGERAGFMPRPTPTVPPPIKPGQGKPTGLYRAPLPKSPPPRPTETAPPAETAPTAEGTVPTPKKKQSNKLTSQQKTGKADLNTFAQLAALFGPKEEPKPAAPAPAPEAPKAEEPKPPVVEEPKPADPPPVAEAPPPAEPTPTVAEEPKPDEPKAE